MYGMVGMYVCVYIYIYIYIYISWLLPHLHMRESIEHAGLLHILAREVTPVDKRIYCSPIFLFSLLLPYPTLSGCGAFVCKWRSTLLQSERNKSPSQNCFSWHPHPCVYRWVKVVCAEKKNDWDKSLVCVDESVFSAQVSPRHFLTTYHSSNSSSSSSSSKW